MLDRYKRIARLIGDMRDEEWDVEDSDPQFAVDIFLRSDPRIRFALYFKDGRIVVRDRYPGNAYDGYPPKDQRPKAPGFGRQRPDDQIARGICKFLLDYIDALEEGYRRKDAADRGTKLMEEMAAHLGGILGIEVNPSGTGSKERVRGHVGGFAGNGIFIAADMSPGLVKMDLSYIPWDLATAVARLVAAYPGKKKDMVVPGDDAVRALFREVLGDVP